ncbi:centrosomal protein of 295 kDa isoform X2 [Toxotes jaculatrix]|uniref:centrosomal protein of 295 kDa isoform X2 n=1 Tax=Toxotes jaculatrix TaxID=941984 RepID=UPI001B3A94C1|nr:centrosomal protein of 295 kDa isoform X2 [Toxotes jaculatrix]
MKRKVAKLRLSPNEEARLIREEHERRRKLRIQQVREQQRLIAQQIRQAVEQRRQHELDQLAEELRQDWERQQREKLVSLQRLYQESLQLLGQGHSSAKDKEPDWAAIAQREEDNRAKAEERYREALKELKSQRLKDHERQSQAINARKKALQVEKDRSAKVASLPPPPPNPTQNIDFKKPHVVKISDVSAFAATHYHMLESTVDREVDTQQLNAHEEAELEVRRVQDLQREEKRRKEEQLEKARLRGKQALRREQLVQDRERLLVELEHMQQTDLLRRRQQVSQMPPQIFQPLYKRQEVREDFQREMEFAFEDMYTGERRVKGDLVVQLVPEALPALSTGSQDQELDVTLDEITTPGTENTQHDAEQEAASTEQGTFAQAEPSKPAPRRALKKLLDRIRSQRNQWTEHNSHVPAADSPTVITDQIPERDTTIETGSLTSVEKDKPTPIELPEPAHSPPALETTAQSTVADTLLPDALANRSQEFEEEQKKRRETQQQAVLLQELEEQKAKLEQMLLEAQQERENLKAAVTQEVPVNQPHTPVHDQHVAPISPGLAAELEPPAGEDDHTRRIREYQQRLLEQNRIHQRSVEVARQRLEEYQQALRMRYTMTSMSLLPAVMPPGVSHPPLHSTQSVYLPAPLQLPTIPAVPSYIHNQPQTSLEVPTRESETPASPPHLPGSSFSVGSKLLPDEVESCWNSPSIQRPDVTAWLTDSIMERVTEHLPERVRPSSLTTEPLPYKLCTTHHSPSIPLQPGSDMVQAISPSITDGAPLVPGHVAAKPGTLLRGSLQTGSLSSRGDDMEMQRRELQEQREAVVLQRRQQEEERQRREEEMEQMRWQKETLQGLIHTDTQRAPEADREVLVSEDIGQTRVRLLASLLRALEESNGGTLSRLEETQEKDGFSQQPPFSSAETDPFAQTSAAAGPAPVSVLPSGFPPAPRAAKPPVTRVRLGIMEMTEQHELSAIQEVDTPVSPSQVTGPEDIARVPSHTVDWDRQQESDSSVASDRTMQTPSVSSDGKRTSERPTCSGTSSERSSQLILREKLLLGAGTSPESSEPDSVLRIISPLSSDSGRGADFSGPAITSCRFPIECPHRPPDSDCLSSTTISTGSYITTDPEQNLNTDKSPPVRCYEEQEQRAELSDVSSPSGQSSCIKNSLAAGHPGVEHLFNDSSIQHIIDRYTRELNISLSTAGRTTDSEGSCVEEPGSSVSQQSVVRASERRLEDAGSAGRQCPPSDTAGMQTGGLERNQTACPIMEYFSGESTHVDFAVSAEAFSPSCPALPPEASSHSATAPGMSPYPEDQILQNQTSSMNLGPERTEVFLGSDSFHPLLAEVTHNETADPSMTFHLLKHRVPNSPEGEPASGEHSVSTPPVDSEASPECLRTEKPALHESSQCLSHESVLMLEDTMRTDVELTAVNLSNLTMCDDTPAVGTHTQSARGAALRNHISKRPGDSVSFSDLCAEDLESEQGSNLRSDIPVSDKILEAASEKGILEQSEITLVSLTDTTLQDQETTVTEEEGVWEDKHPDGAREEGQKSQETQESESTLLPVEMLEDKDQTRPVMFLEFQWGPNRGLQEVNQQKYRALLQRSSCRVENIKAKGAVAKIQPEIQAPPEAREKSKAEESQPVSLNDPRLKKVDEVKIDISEMHQRTQRLYEQLEEVKHQKTIRSRQEAYAKNRLKAKEFHQKTLQKLRAKRTRQ